MDPAIVASESGCHLTGLFKRSVLVNRQMRIKKGPENLSAPDLKNIRLIFQLAGNLRFVKLAPVFVII
jgi:hypothetical protein